MLLLPRQRLLPLEMRYGRPSLDFRARTSRPGLGAPRKLKKATSFTKSFRNDWGFERSTSSATLASKTVAISSVDSQAQIRNLSRHQYVVGSVGFKGEDTAGEVPTGNASECGDPSVLVRAHEAAELDAEARAQPAPLPAGSRRRRRRFDPDWVECQPRRWQAEIRNARAHRLPPGVGWSDVARRVTTDSRTGEVLEDTSQVGEFVSQEFALRRLDKVRDIQVEVYVRDMREENLKPQPIEWSRLGPQERWGDIESD